MQSTDTFILYIKLSEWCAGSQLVGGVISKEKQLTDTHTKQMNSDIFSLTFFNGFSLQCRCPQELLTTPPPRLPPSLTPTHILTNTQLLHANTQADVQDHRAIFRHGTCNTDDFMKLLSNGSLSFRHRWLVWKCSLFLYSDMAGHWWKEHCTAVWYLVPDVWQEVVSLLGNSCELNDLKGEEFFIFSHNLYHWWFLRLILLKP